jgi:hypothetical protein
MIFRRIGRKPGQDLKIMSKLFPAAEAAALADGLGTAGAEYLVLAAFGLNDGSARRAFERLGASPDDYRLALRAQHAEALGAVGMKGIDDTVLDRHLPEPRSASGPVKTAPSAHKMFKAVVKKVQKDRSQLYSAYFVLAATETEHGTTIRAIRHLGIDPAALNAAARAEIEALRQNAS